MFSKSDCTVLPEPYVKDTGPTYELQQSLVSACISPRGYSYKMEGKTNLYPKKRPDNARRNDQIALVVNRHDLHIVFARLT